MTPEVCLGSYNREGFLVKQTLSVEETVFPVGSGFAGEVVRTAITRENTSPLEVAIKILRPPVFKEIIRDRLWAVSGNEPFPLEQCEEAVCYSLLCWQIFAEVAKRVFPEDLKLEVNPSVGYFYEETKKAFALVSPFIQGKAGQPEVRNFFLKGRQEDVFGQKTQVLTKLSELAKEMGMEDMSRQFQKWTLVSPANVLQRDGGNFVAVDMTPGLCIRIPLSPYDLGVFWRDIKKGEWGKRHFLGLNTEQLRNFLIKNEFDDLRPLFKTIESMPQTFAGNTFANLWRRRDFITEEERKILEEKERWPVYFALAKYLPILELSRKSNRDLLRESWASQLSRERKISEEWRKRIAESDSWLMRYLFWEEPKRIGKEVIDKLIVAPVKIIAGDRKFIRGWLETLDCHPAVFEERSFKQVEAENDIRDMVATIVLEPLLKIASVSFLAGLDFRLGALAAMIEIPLVPLPFPSPAGICRAGYLLVRSVLDLPAVAKTQESVKEKLKVATSYFLKRLVLSFAVSLKTFGNLVLPIKLYASHPDETTAIARYVVDKTVGKIPIFGEKSGVLQQYVFDLCFNLPRSFLEAVGKELKRVLPHRNPSREQELKS